MSLLNGLVSGIPGMFLDGLGNLIGSFINNRNQAKAALSQFNMTKELQDRTDRFQRNLISDLPKLNKSAMQNAGFSTAAMDGAFSTAATNATATPPAMGVSEVQMPSFMDKLMQGKQVSILNNQADKEKALADQAKIQAKEMDYDLKVKKAEGYRWYQLVQKRKEEEAKRLALSKGKGSIDEVTVSKENPFPYLSKGSYEIEMGLADSRTDRELMENTSIMHKNQVEDFVHVEQINDPELMKKMSKLPEQQFNQLSFAVKKLMQETSFFDDVKDFRKKIEKYGVDKAYWEIENLKAENGIKILSKAMADYNFELDKSMNLKGIIHKIMDLGDFSFENVAKLFFILAASYFKNGAGLKAW